MFRKVGFFSKIKKTSEQRVHFFVHENRTKNVQTYIFFAIWLVKWSFGKKEKKFMHQSGRQSKVTKSVKANFCKK
jgi:restriction endonuclease S subunit